MRKIQNSTIVQFMNVSCTYIQAAEVLELRILIEAGLKLLRPRCRPEVRFDRP